MASEIQNVFVSLIVFIYFIKFTLKKSKINQAFSAVQINPPRFGPLKRLKDRFCLTQVNSRDNGIIETLKRGDGSFAMDAFISLFSLVEGFHTIRDISTPYFGHFNDFNIDEASGSQVSLKLVQR